MIEILVDAGKAYIKNSEATKFKLYFSLLNILLLQKTYGRGGGKDRGLFHATAFLTPIMANTFPSWLCLTKHCDDVSHVWSFLGKLCGT